jgi:predicted NBD/HSP70 family sugar kinase
MYYIGLDVHKRKISYCVKDGSGRIHAEGSISAARITALLRSASGELLPS